MRKTINVDFDNSSSVILGRQPDILGTKASGYALSTHTHGNISLNLTNITGTYTSVSNGLTLNLSADLGGGGGGTFHAGDNIILSTALGHTTISALDVANATHDHGGAPSVTGLIGGTISSDAWSISIPDFLLTAALSDHTHSNLMGNDTSTVSIAGTNLTLAADEFGISLGIPRWITTAALSTHVHGSFLGTNITRVSSGSGGLALSVAPKLGTNTSSNTVSGSTFYMGGDETGLTLSMPNFITTAAQVAHVHGNVSLDLANISGSYSSASSGLTISLSGATYDFIPKGSSTDFIGINTAATNVTWTVNSSGISFDAGGYAGTTTAATNVGLTVNSQGIRVSLDTAGLTSFGDGVNILAAGGSTAASNTTIGFINTNRVSFSLNSDSLIASIAEYILTGFTTTATAGTAVVGTANSLGLKLGIPAFITSETYSAIKGIIVSNTTYSSGSVSFSNANNISFGSSGEGVITASVSYPTQSVQPVAISDSATSMVFSTLSLGTNNGLTLYLSNSSLIGSYTVPTQTSQPRVVSINGTSGSLSISASRNISINSSEGSAFTFYGPANIVNSFSLGGNVGTTGSSNITGGGFVLAGGDHITLSQSNNIISIYADGGPVLAAQGIGTTFSSGTVVLSGQANITLNTTEVGGIQYIRLSAGGGTETAGADGGNILAAGSETAQSTGNVKFINSNGVTFGMSNNSDITATVAAISRIIVSDATLVSNFISFSNANNISFGTSGANVITISTGTHGHTQYVGVLSTGITGASATINNSAHFIDIPQGSLYYQDGSGITWGASSSGLSTTITASVETNYLSALGEYIQEVNLTGNTAGTVTDVSSGTLFLAGGNNITLSQEGNSITISGANLGGAQTGISGIAGSGASTVSMGTVVFGNANGISFGLNSNTMTASWQSTNFIGTEFMNYWQATEVSKGLIATTYTQHTHGSNISWGSTTNTSETVMRATSASNGLTIVVPPYITNVAGHTHGSAVSTVSTSGTATAISFSSASGGLTVTIPPYAVTSHTHSNLYANVAHSHGGLSTYATNGTALLFSSASSGLSLSIPAWITTAGEPNHTHGSNVSLATTNLLGANAASASNGLTISISGYPATSFVNVSQSHILNFNDSNGISFGSNVAGYSTTITANYAGPRAVVMVGSNTLGVTASASSGTLQLSAGSNITLSQNGNIIEIRGASGGAGNISISAGTLSATRGSIVFSNANSVSFGMSGSTITASIPIGTVNFSDGSGVTWGSSTNGVSTTITASVGRYSFSNIAGFSFVTSTYASVPGVTQILLSTA